MALPRPERPVHHRTSFEPIDRFSWSLACLIYGHPVLSAVVITIVFLVGGLVMLALSGFDGPMAWLLVLWISLCAAWTWYGPQRVVGRIVRDETPTGEPAGPM